MSSPNSWKADGCDGFLSSVGDGLGSTMAGQKDFAVRRFGFREAAGTTGARQRKRSARKSPGRLQTFQELFGRDLEERRRAIDESIAAMEAVARPKVADLEQQTGTRSRR
jgi:hypothetical protein